MGVFSQHSVEVREEDSGHTKHLSTPFELCLHLYQLKRFRLHVWHKCFQRLATSDLEGGPRQRYSIRPVTLSR